MDDWLADWRGGWLDAWKDGWGGRMDEWVVLGHPCSPPHYAQ